MHHSEVLALELLATPGAVLDLFGVGLASLVVVEEYPPVLSPNPPKLTPERVILPTRTT